MWNKFSNFIQLPSGTTLWNIDYHSNGWSDLWDLVDFMDNAAQSANLHLHSQLKALTARRWSPLTVSLADRFGTLTGSTPGLAESQPQLNLESRSLGLLRRYLSFDVSAQAIDVCYFTSQQRIDSQMIGYMWVKYKYRIGIVFWWKEMHFVHTPQHDVRTFLVKLCCLKYSSIKCKDFENFLFLTPYCVLTTIQW